MAPCWQGELTQSSISKKKSVWETRPWNNKGSQYWPSRITSSLIWMNPVQYKEIYSLFMPWRPTSSKCAWILMTTDRSFVTLIIVRKTHQLGNTVWKQYIKETHKNLSPHSKLRSSNTSAICGPIYYHGHTLRKKTDEYHLHHNSSHRNCMHSWQNIAFDT